MYICIPVSEFLGLCVHIEPRWQNFPNAIAEFTANSHVPVQGARGLHLWLFSTCENSSRSFTWQRVAFIKELLVPSDFSVTVTLGRLKFLVPQFLSYLYDYCKEHPNIPVWNYVIYIHSVFCFWYTSVCCVATLIVNASDEYFCYIYLHIFWERVACPEGHQSDEIILSKRQTT